MQNKIINKNFRAKKTYTNNSGSRLRLGIKKRLIYLRNVHTDYYEKAK